MIHVPRSPGAECGFAHGAVVKTAWKLQGQANFPHSFCSIFSHGVDISYELRRETQEGRQAGCIVIKNMAWLRNLKRELGTRCHGRRCRVWRWEQAVAQCICEKWTEEAQSNTGWRAKLEEMICWRTQKMEDRNCVAME